MPRQHYGGGGDFAHARKKEFEGWWNISCRSVCIRADEEDCDWESNKTLTAVASLCTKQRHTKQSEKRKT